MDCGGKRSATPLFEPEGSPEPVRFRIAPPQPGAWRHYTRFDGVPPGSLFYLCFDREGSLWMTSSDGLTRFDGQNWRTFTTRDGLDNNYTKAIMVTKEGELLLGSGRDGISRFNGRSWEPWPTAKGTIWMGTALGITRYEDGSFKFCEHEDGIGNPNNIAPGYAANLFTGEVWALIVDRHDNVRAGSVVSMGTDGRLFAPPRLVPLLRTRLEIYG